MPVFLAAPFIKRLDFSVGLAEQRSYIVSPKGSSNKTVWKKQQTIVSSQPASVGLFLLSVNEKMYPLGNYLHFSVVFSVNMIK